MGKTRSLVVRFASIIASVPVETSPMLAEDFKRTVMQRMFRRCGRCGKRWCGTNLRVMAVHPGDPTEWDRVTFGSKKCRDKGPKR